MNAKLRIHFLPIILVLIGCESNYVNYHSMVNPEKGDFNYALYLDGVGFGDPGFMVVKLEKDIDPKGVYIKWTPGEGINQEMNHEQIDWFRKRIILENYAEAGFHTQNPKIELINKRYLVFSRGGYYYGLYDLFLEKDTFNIGSPWNEWRNKSRYQSGKYDKNKEEDLYEEWVKNNLHKKIECYISANK